MTPVCPRRYDADEVIAIKGLPNPSARTVKPIPRARDLKRTYCAKMLR